MSQLFQPRADAVMRFMLWTLLLGGMTTLITAEGLSHSDWLSGRDIIQPQPTEFSHQHHAGELGIDCRYCHTTVDDGCDRRDATDPHVHDLSFADLD